MALKVTLKAVGRIKSSTIRSELLLLICRVTDLSHWWRMSIQDGTDPCNRRHNITTLGNLFSERIGANQVLCTLYLESYVFAKKVMLYATRNQIEKGTREHLVDFLILNLTLDCLLQYVDSENSNCNLMEKIAFRWHILSNNWNDRRTICWPEFKTNHRTFFITANLLANA